MAETPWKYALIDFNDLKDDLKITTTEFDDRLMRIVNGVSRAIESYCNREFKPRYENAIEIDGDGTSTLLLKAPIISLGTITNDTASVTSTHYEYYSTEGRVVLTNGTVWAAGNKKITITYTHGYEDQDFPADVATAARMWAAGQYQYVQDKRMGVASKSTNDTSISYIVSTDMPPEVRSLLAPYRLMGVMG